jgi:hypothetical protein
LQKEDEVIDVGSSFGAYSVAISVLAGSKGRIFVFEPSQFSFINEFTRGIS